jgi:uncharacterized lipoprotein YddW (UPF0748 family)
MDSQAMRRGWAVAWVVAGILSVGIGGARALGAADEFRGMWVSRFEWPDPDETACKAYIDQVMEKLAANNFNAVIFQMRGQADTLYPSPSEPWSPIISPTGADPGWDPMAYAVNAAHAKGLEFHAYINAHVCWQSGTGTPPLDPTHLYYQHCNAADAAHRDWLVHDAGGTPVQYASDNYVWIAPGVPDFQAYWREQVMYVVTQYDGSGAARPVVDGLHFDRIRTPAPTYSHDPISEARRLGEGNPDGLTFEDWTREQITRMLCDLYAQVMEVRPQVKMSSSPLGLVSQDRYPGYPSGYLYGRTQCYQDAQAWLAAGAQDFVVPQIYWADPPYRAGTPHFSEVLPDWLANSAGRHIYAGQNQSVTAPELVHEIGVTRTMGGQGNVVFSYSNFDGKDYWSAYSGPGGPYEQAATLPPMPWKDAPTTGIIIGKVTDVGGEPIVDAQVTRSGLAYTALSSADGVYSFLLVPPGTHTLTFIKPGVASQTVSDVVVGAGEVKRVDVTLSGPDATPPIIRKVAWQDVTDTQATITWWTNEFSDSVVRFGTTAGARPFQAGGTSLVASHSVTLRNLKRGATYYFVVNSADRFNNIGSSAEYQFTTAVAPPDFIVESRSDGLNYVNYSESGTFSDSTAKSTAAGCTASGSRYATSAGVQATYAFTPTVTSNYEVFATWGTSTNGATQVTHVISHAGGTFSLVVNQNSAANLANQWNSLGVYEMEAGTTYTVTQTLPVAQNPPRLMADAVKWVIGPPLVNAGDDKTVFGRSATVRVGGSPTAAGGTPVYENGKPKYTYQWTAAPSAGTTFDDATASNPAFTVTTPGTYQVCVTVTDAAGQYATNCVTVTLVSSKDMVSPPAGVTKVVGAAVGAGLGGGNASIAFGDINGDGYPDAIIGSPTLSDSYGYFTYGSVTIIYGSKQISGETLIALSAAPPPGVSVTVVQGNGGMFGAAVAAGDVNGDGFDDVIVGAHGYTATSNSTGEAYILYGQADIAAYSSLWIGYSSGVKTTRIAASQWTPRVAFGWSVATGDLNADGYADVVIGSSMAAPASRDGAGIVYAFYGSATASTITLIDLTYPDGTYGEVRIFGGTAHEQFGTALACGDVNGDGYDDIIGGSPNASPAGRANAGAAYVIYGSAAISNSTVGNPLKIDLEEHATLPAGIVVTRIRGDDAGDLCGHAVATGDVNGDGFFDAILGAHLADPPGGTNGGEAYVVYGASDLGQSSKIVDLGLTPPSNANVTRILGQYYNDQCGWAVATGDVNGDGIDDLLIGANLADSPAAPPLRVDAGKLYVEYGKADLKNTSQINLATAHDYAAVFGATAGDRLGNAVAGGADMNFDGIADFIVSAPQVTRNTGAGYAVYGSQGTLQATAHRWDRAADAPLRDFGPAARCTIDFAGADGSVSDTAVTLIRGKQTAAMSGLNQAADVLWKVHTDRGGAWTATVTLRYLDSEVQGLDPSTLVVYRADTLAGPFVALPTTIDTTRNTATVSITQAPDSVFALRTGRAWTVTPVDDVVLTVPQESLTLPGPFPYTITANTTVEEIDLTVTKDQDWVTLDKAGTRLWAGAGSDTVTAAMNSRLSSLTPGQYTCALVFQDPSDPDALEMRNITVTVLACDWTVSERTALTATGTAGTGPFSPDGFAFDITNNGEGDIDYTVQSNATWITLSKSYGGPLAPGKADAVRAGINASAASLLVPGTYTCTLTFTMDCAIVTKQITLTITCGSVPTVTSITPPAAQEGTTVTASLTGSDFFTGLTTVKLTQAGQPDIVATNVIVNDLTHLTCSFNLSGAAWGTWDVAVATCSAATPLAGAFQVTCSPPTVQSMSPSSGIQGQSLTNVSVSGGNFIAGKTSVRLKLAGPPDIYIDATNVRVMSRTSLLCDLTLPADAELTAWTLEVNTCACASAADAFSVLCNPPTVTSIAPSFGPQDGVVTGIAISGSNFDTVPGNTAVRFVMAGQPDIVATNVLVRDPGHLTCEVDLSGAALGKRSVVVSTCADATLASAFEVTVPCENWPVVSLAAPITATQGETLVGVTIPGSHFVPGLTTLKLQKSGEADIRATNVSVAPDGKSLSADVSLAGAAVGRWNVVVATCAQTTATDAFMVRPACGATPADADTDGDVDLGDFLVFQACFNGPNRPWTAPPEGSSVCGCFDSDGDGDVDIADFLVFQACFNGPNRSPACGH